jgi:hypothetical protein
MPSVMLISRCAWHPFFRGYPRPWHVVSWRGRGIAFSDTICPSCAARVRIEGLWAPSPPTPVWPGSAQTAVLFVGLPLLIALVLMAAPLHDAPPPPAAGAAAAALAADDVAGRTVVAAGPRTSRRPVAVSPARRGYSDPVPDVIFETRRVIRASHRPAQALSRPQPATATTAPLWLRRPRSPERRPLAAVGVPSVAARAAVETQSP